MKDYFYTISKGGEGFTKEKEVNLLDWLFRVRDEGGSKRKTGRK